MRWLRVVAYALTAAAPLAYLAVLRPWYLTWGATPEEANRDLPGDELVRHPTWETTRAVTIAAPPAEVWPWLVQMGTGRAGFYSLDRLDNRGQPSATRIVPEWQDLKVGDVMPAGPEGEGFTVVRLEPPRLLVVHDPSPDTPRLVRGAAMVWALALEECPEGTRLLSRIRLHVGRTAISQLYALAFEPIDFVMMRVMRANIRSRAEQAARPVPVLAPAAR